MKEELFNSMQAKFDTEAVEIPSQLFIKLNNEYVSLTTFVKEEGKLAPIEVQWK